MSAASADEGVAGGQTKTSDVPVLVVDGFEGPMDVLLDLAERQRIDLGRLSIAELATQFVDAMERCADRVPLEQRAAWLVLATRLVVLRSRLMLATDAEQEAERDAVLRDIEAGLAMREAAAWLAARPRLGQDVFGRGQGRTAPQTGYVALMEACLAVLRGPKERPRDVPLYQPRPLDLWRVSDALARIRAMLAERPEGGTLVDFLPFGLEGKGELAARAAVAGTFVAGLELARAAEITLREEMTGELTLRRQLHGGKSVEF